LDRPCPAAVVFLHHHQAATKELKGKSDGNPDYETIFRKNQWPDEVRAQLGYKKPQWDMDN
jgi:hypothetical protein